MFHRGTRLAASQSDGGHPPISALIGRISAKRMMRPWLSHRALAIYIACIVLAGTAATVRSVHALMLEPVGLQWYLLLGLALVSDIALLKIPGTPANFSVSDTFTITAAMIYGPAAGTVVVALDALFITYRLSRTTGLPAHRAIFNASAPPLAMWLSAQVLVLLPRGVPLADGSLHLLRLIVLLALFAASYFVLNTGMIAAAVGAAGPVLATEGVARAFLRSLADLLRWRCHSRTGLPAPLHDHVESRAARRPVAASARALRGVQALDRAPGRSAPPPGRSEFPVSLDHRGARPGDRREGPFHARPHSPRADVRRPAGA